MDILNLLTVSVVLVSYSNAGILSSQCKARCISDNIHWKTSTLQTIEDCHDDLNCSSCLLPCLREYKTQTSCKNNCLKLAENEIKCNETCEFLKLNYHNKIGTCVKPTEATGFARTCMQTCANDSDCGGRKKCCYNGCGRTCQDPVTKSKDIPAKPRNNINVSEVTGKREILLEWSLRSSNSPSHIVYFVIQGRNNTGHHPSGRRMDRWYHVADTVIPYYTLSAKPGVFYEFQIAAVNQNGTVGFNRPSKPFKLSMDPEPPFTPKNLRLGEQRHENNSVTSVIYWDTPQSDLEILRYRVFWSMRLSSISPVYVNLNEHRRNVPPDQNQYAIKGLQANTKYFVQVCALSQWGSTRLKSERNSIYLVTIDTNQPGDQPDPLPVHPINPYYELLPTPPPVRDIKDVDPPFWSNNSLNVKINWRKPLGEDHGVNRYMLYWLPTVCLSLSNRPSVAKNATTHSLEFMLYGLMFDCKYKVIIHPVDSNFRQGQPSTLMFYTPPCNEVNIKSKQKPVCPTPAPDVPSEPIDLNNRFSLGKILTLGLEWNPPSHKPEIVTGYQVTWGERKVQAGSSLSERFEVIKDGTAITKTLPSTQRWFEIENLSSDVQYVVKVQTLCEIGGGGTAVMVVKPPKVYDNPSHKPSKSPETFVNDALSNTGNSSLTSGSSVRWFFFLSFVITVRWLRS